MAISQSYITRKKLSCNISPLEGERGWHRTIFFLSVWSGLTSSKLFQYECIYVWNHKRAGRPAQGL